ncbi:MAG: peptidoglycan DD-metalloendopeptidase family protein [Prevotella sp.]|jgi:murein DD-endopeptidase MepM/ murein hydrolase activator NlpD|nr:peptidoglycan DD-metalloendopeptidase family protein [Prevotella sp.]
MIKTLKKIFAIAMVSIAAVPSQGQDLLARQAPIDRKMKAVDSVALSRLIQFEQMASPAADLYDDWENHYAHRETALPDTFRIDLRDFHMPTDNRVLTSNFGARWGRQHKGLDIKVYIGDTIRAAFSGKVRVVRYEAGGYGNFVVIRHYNGLETIYGHMSKHLVKPDQEVRAGDPIGLGGNTGRSTGSHLHFETRLCGVALNPALMFDFRNQDVVGDFYTFRRSTYSRESLQATRLRGVGGSASDDAVGDQLYTQSSKQTASARNTRFHKVRKGETLSSIARKRNTSVAAICKLNRIGKNMKLRPGQILKYN